MWRKLQTAWRLSPSARSQFLAAYGLLLLITISMQLGGLRWTCRWLRWGVKDRAGKPSPYSQIKITLAMVRLAVRYSPWSNCIRQALTLWALLRWQGVDTHLQIGTRRMNGKFESHAWLEYQGQVVGDRADVRQQYQAFGRAIEF